MQLWIRRTDADLDEDALPAALEAAARDPLIERHRGGFVVAGTYVAARVGEGLTADDVAAAPGSDEARRRLERDPRRFRHLILESDTASGGPALRLLGMVLASEVGASLYDPRRDEWIMASEAAMGDARDQLTA